MRIPFLSMFVTSPFDGLQEHALKVKEGAWIFQEAMECHISNRCPRFEELRREIGRLESEADAVKRRIRGHIPKGTLLPVDKFQLFRYLREQDSILDAVEDVLNWISYRIEPGIPAELSKDFLLLVDTAIDPIDMMSQVVDEARKYFRNYSDPQRVTVKKLILTLREQENKVDRMEADLKRKIFNTQPDATTIFHMVRLTETIGFVADHAENAGDMMRAMVAR